MDYLLIDMWQHLCGVHARERKKPRTHFEKKRRTGGDKRIHGRKSKPPQAVVENFRVFFTKPLYFRTQFTLMKPSPPPSPAPLKEIRDYIKVIQPPLFFPTIHWFIRNVRDRRECELMLIRQRTQLQVKSRLIVVYQESE